MAAPCDLLSLPGDAATRLGPGPAVARDQWLLGLWPATLAPVLDEFLLPGQQFAVQFFARAVDAREVPMEGLLNVNRPDDLPPD